MSLNSSHIILFRNIRDKKQISVFASQYSPKNTRFVVDSYLDATNSPFSYLLIDLSQTTPEELRLRTRIFPSDKPLQNIVYKERI